MRLYAVAYPTITAQDHARIQEFRRQNDGHFDIIEPHFTLVFPTPGWEVAPFVAEVRKQARGFSAFDFCIRCATLDKDAFNDSYHAFLVPDEGYSNLVKLHYRLSADRFFPYRVLEVDFIPHIGVGNSTDPLRCMEMVESWNKTEFAIAGRISVLDVGTYDKDRVETIERVQLDV